MFYTKNKAKQIQGLAILLMIYHHEFMDAFSFNHVSLIGLSVEQKIAWFGKICVSLFAFASGYGICRIIKVL